MDENVDTTTVEINGMQIPTRTYNFHGLGKWTIRGILGAEDIELQSSVEITKEAGKVKVNAADLTYQRIRKCTVESPYGNDPAINEMQEKLLKGVIETLSNAIDELSEVPYDIEKN